MSEALTLDREVKCDEVIDSLVERLFPRVVDRDKLRIVRFMATGDYLVCDRNILFPGYFRDGLGNNTDGIYLKIETKTLGPLSRHFVITFASVPGITDRKLNSIITEVKSNYEALESTR